MQTTSTDDTIGFGGGCHWCTEAVFQDLRGVNRVEQGFIKSTPPDDSFSEAVIVHFNPAPINLSVLTNIHLRTHASGADHSMRGKYRSAVYVKGEAQRQSMAGILDALQTEFETPRVTKILQHVEFRPSESQFQNYYKTNPERPFCKTYIDPKLARVRNLLAGT